MRPHPRIAPVSTFLLLLALAGGRADAQTIRGEVTDSDGESPIEGVTLRLLDLQGTIVAGTTSDAEGRFRFTPSAGGFYAIAAERIGYQNYRSDAVSVPDGQSVTVRVRLGVDAIPLAPFVVLADSQLGRGRVADFERRRRDPSITGHFLSEEAIRSRPMATATEQLETVAAVDLYRVMTQDNRFGLDRHLIYLPGSRAGSLLDGKCLAQVFVNGATVRQSQDGASTVDDYLSGVPLSGIEVYTRAAAAPFEYRGTGECGVVLYWTEESQASSSRGWGVTRIAIGVGMIAGVLVLGFTR